MDVGFGTERSKGDANRFFVKKRRKKLQTISGKQVTAPYKLKLKARDKTLAFVLLNYQVRQGSLV